MLTFVKQDFRPVVKLLPRELENINAINQIHTFLTSPPFQRLKETNKNENLILLHPLTPKKVFTVFGVVVHS